MHFKLFAIWGLTLSSVIGSPLPEPRPKPDPLPAAPAPHGAVIGLTIAGITITISSALAFKCYDNSVKRKDNLLASADKALKADFDTAEKLLACLSANEAWKALSPDNPQWARTMTVKIEDVRIKYSDMMEHAVRTEDQAKVAKIISQELKTSIIPPIKAKLETPDKAPATASGGKTGKPGPSAAQAGTGTKQGITANKKEGPQSGSKQDVVNKPAATGKQDVANKVPPIGLRRANTLPTTPSKDKPAPLQRSNTLPTKLDAKATQSKSIAGKTQAAPKSKPVTQTQADPKAKPAAQKSSKPAKANSIKFRRSLFANIPLPYIF